MVAPASESAPAVATESAPTPAVPMATPTEPAGQTLAAVRLLLEPKKRGEGVTALVSTVAERLGQSQDKLLEALVAAGLSVPEDAKEKPKFGELGGEIFWLNRSAKGDLWINAKESKAAAAKKSRGRKKDAAED